MVHPGPGHDEDLAPRRYDDLTIHRASTIDLHADITHAVVTLIYSDVAQRYPNVSIQVVNLGGAFPMLVERMDHIVATRNPRAPRPSTLLRPLMFDTASLGPRSLELAVAVLGGEQIMMGTDYPIFDSPTASDALARALIPETTREAIATSNALRVLRIRATTPPASGP
jgi:aminocarboxymuconate-semialdehyde decarboxylase